MICTVREKQQVPVYSLLVNEGVFEGERVTQFGIEQVFFDNGVTKTITSISDISDEYQVVMDLLNRLEGQDVDPVTLEYIVEDYLAEIYGL
ncbi:DUF6514 family protein [Paludicola sp. MB14-C6]|uniref:DUF6514 family protein n=1 Tax=Paludihabitans sp. MB14-C6 TaxID=3070656 RepID=UPI0027DC92DE|nr:DUF6514 family protein [Paludicola sp. MB14-C6]WMJ23500.1 DUF6514 family protein [Paludicola sp. MB14-C6]